MINQENLSNGSYAEKGEALASTVDVFSAFQGILALIVVLAVAYVVVAHILPMFREQKTTKTKTTATRHYTLR